MHPPDPTSVTSWSAAAHATRVTRCLIIAGLLTAPSGAGAMLSIPVELSTWIVENYLTDGNGSWSLSGVNNEIATQLVNGHPTLFLSGGSIDVSAQRQIRGTLRVDGGDDDIIGFVFGYQNRGQMYLFSWKKETQVLGLRGMGVIRLDTGSADSDPARSDFGLTTSPSPAQTVFVSNDLGWVAGVPYTYDLVFGMGEFRVTLSDGTTTLVDWLVTDSTFTAGDFGFLNSSQPNAVYSAFIPEPATGVLLATGLVMLGVGRDHRRAWTAFLERPR